MLAASRARGPITLAGLVLAALAGPAPAAAQAPELVIVEPDSLEVAYSGGTTDPYTVWVRNTGSEMATVRFSANVQTSDRKGVAVTAASSNADVAAHSVERFHVTFAGMKKGRLSGELVALADDYVPGTVDLEIGPKREIKALVNLVVGGALLVALVLVAIRWLTLKGPLGVTPGSRVGAAKFDFSKSFASTITVVGAVLGTVLTAGVVPAHPEHLSKDEYLSLNLLFGVMVVVAGIAFSASERPEAKSPKAGEERKYEGSVGALLFSAAMVLWAVVGEVICIGLIIDELGGTGVFTTLAVLVFWALLVVAASATLTYTYKRIYWVVEHCSEMRHEIDVVDGTAIRSRPQATATWSFF